AVTSASTSRWLLNERVCAGALLLAEPSPKSHQYASGSLFGSVPVAVKLTLCPTETCDALAETESDGGRLEVNGPTFTVTSSDSGLVPPLPVGVMYTVLPTSPKVLPITSGESSALLVHGVMSSSCDS